MDGTLKKMKMPQIEPYCHFWPNESSKCLRFSAQRTGMQKTSEKVEGPFSVRPQTFGAFIWPKVAIVLTQLSSSPSDECFISRYACSLLLVWSVPRQTHEVSLVTANRGHNFLVWTVPNPTHAVGIKMNKNITVWGLPPKSPPGQPPMTFRRLSPSPDEKKLRNFSK